MLQDLWEGIDRATFCQNAILLELKHRSQGNYVKMNMSNASARCNSIPPSIYPYEVRDLLDDMSLIASGTGGAHRVTAACLEVANHEQRMIIIRMASNAGIDGELLDNVRRLLEEIAQACAEGCSDDDVRNLTLAHIVRQCRVRFRKHIVTLHHALSRMGTTLEKTPPDLPLISVDPLKTCERNPEDIRAIGTTESKHSELIEEQQERLIKIKSCIAKAACAFTNTSNQELESLLILAYEVRKSSTFRQLIDHYFRGMANSKVHASNTDEVIERLGQLSKFVRAATSVVKHLRRMSRAGIKMRVEALPSKTIRVPELSTTTAAQLRRRGGKRCNNLSDVQLQSMIKRWNSYREHAEIQLLMFYEENPDKTLHTNYIGCNKECCFLCFHFIVQHGRFHVSGCHQSLYSLWSVRDYMETEDPATATRINQALASLSGVLDGKVELLRDLSHKYNRGGNGKESIANLSRTSLAMTHVSTSRWAPVSSRNTVADDRSPLHGFPFVMEVDQVSPEDLQASMTDVLTLESGQRNAIGRDTHCGSQAHTAPVIAPRRRTERFDSEPRRSQMANQGSRWHFRDKHRRLRNRTGLRTTKRSVNHDKGQRRTRRARHTATKSSANRFTKILRKGTKLIAKLLFGAAYKGINH